MGALQRQLELEPAGEVDGDQGRDVGDAVGGAANPGALGQAPVEELEEALHAQPGARPGPGSAPRLRLRSRPARAGRAPGCGTPPARPESRRPRSGASHIRMVALSAGVRPISAGSGWTASR